jgi:hypothetical protein
MQTKLTVFLPFTILLVSLSALPTDTLAQKTTANVNAKASQDVTQSAGKSNIGSSLILKEPIASQDAKKTQNISLAKIDNRHWLIGADGKPFFAHGITHIGNVRSKHDFMKVSAACRKLGFNAYGVSLRVKSGHEVPQQLGR